MSRKVRRSFAAPLVVTLAVAPACIVSSKPPPQPQPTAQPQPKPVMNPPRPTDTAAAPVDDRAPYPGGAPDTVQQSPPAPAELRSWTVTLNTANQQCYANVPVNCPPRPATCNPPPSRVIECPEGIAVDRPVRVVEQAPGECYAQLAMPPCPKDMACNPPRPEKIACPP